MYVHILLSLRQEKGAECASHVSPALGLYCGEGPPRSW